MCSAPARVSPGRGLRVPRVDRAPLATGANEPINELFPQSVIERAQELASLSGTRSMPSAIQPELRSIVSRFDSENKCLSYLERLRWPTGVTCPRCDAAEGISRIQAREQFDCSSCGYQFSVRAGTIFHASHLPLWKWVLAAFTMVSSKDRISTNRLKDMLGVSYKTAWFLSHRIRAAMEDEARRSDRAVDGFGPSDVSEKHLPRYVDEMVFRLDNRENPFLFRDILLRLVGASSLPYKELIASA